MSDTELPELRASSSQRWINCSGSAWAEAGLPKDHTTYNLEGDLAHTTAARLLAGTMDFAELEEDEDSEMLPAIRHYMAYIDMFRNASPDQDFFIEREVDFSHVVEGRTGTVDAITIHEGTLHIFDFKYGRGVWVDAADNTQMLLYAMGAYREFKDLHNISRIGMHIVQPRMHNIESWTIEPKDLLYWQGYIKAKAEDAMKVNAPRTPHNKACTFCKAAPTCPALYNFLNDVAITRLDQSLADEQIVTVLENEELVKRFMTRVRDAAYDRLLQGHRIKGLKLVDGITRRRLTDEAESRLPHILGERAYTRKLIGVTELQKLVDPATLESLVVSYKCKPSMVKESDKRQAMYREELQF